MEEIAELGLPKLKSQTSSSQVDNHLKVNDNKDKDLKRPKGKVTSTRTRFNF